MNRFLRSLILLLALPFSAACQQPAPGVLLPFCDDGACGFMDTNGETVIAPDYDFAYEFHHGLAAVEKDRLWGFVDKTGELVIPHLYEVRFDFEDIGIARVKKNGLWGVIDKNGKTIAPFEHSFIQAFEDGYAIFNSADGYEGVIRASGEILIEPIFEELKASTFDAPIGYKQGENWGYLDPQTGKPLTPPKFKRVYPFKNGLSQVRFLDPDAHKDNPARELMLGKIGYVDVAGQLIIPAIYDTASVFSEIENLIKVEKDKQYFVFDLAGQKVCDVPDDLYVGSFKNGRALVRKNPVERPIRFGQMDRNCELTLPIKYSRVSEFDGEHTVVETFDGESIFLDIHGKAVATFDYDYVTTFGSDEYASFKKRGRMGIMDRNFKIVAKPKFEFIYSFKGNSTIAFDKDSNIHLVHKDGRTVGPIKKYHLFNPQYDYLTMLYCGQKKAVDKATLRPIGFKWKDYDKCFRSEKD